MPSDALDPEVEAGQAVYRPWTLALYDLAVYRVTCPYFWRVPVAHLLSLYERNLAPNHLDLGVGTGYLLDRCQKPGNDQRITLADLNPYSLDYTMSRLARYKPTLQRVNALEPLPFEPDTFGSAAATMLLHCLPGAIPEKAGHVLDHLAACVKPGGHVFGSTILTVDVPVTLQARAALALFNGRGFFHNQRDSLADLRSVLAARFPLFGLRVYGCAAVFEAEVPAR
ncbi:class I SAM-dependent methyltransferase [Streptomyces sp. NPDC000134]|uniref:class I SAM-dependent methyltransferase n=1 Tax=Streptomyces sp. NPDC000134 TaxID=3364536 RepID=UPI0036B8056E